MWVRNKFINEELLSMVKFIAVGLGMTMLQWVVVFTWFSLSANGYAFVSSFSYVLAASLHYVILKRWVFASGLGMLAFIRFWVMVGVASLFSGLLFVVMASIFSDPYFIQMVISLVLVVFNYTVSRLWVFSNKLVVFS